GLYGVYSTFDKLARSASSTGDPGSLGGSIARYQKKSSDLGKAMSKLAEQQETLRANMVSRFAKADTRISASQSTLSFLQSQIDAWTASKDEARLAFTDPREAYRRSEIDARVEGGADPADLVRLCYEQAISGLGLAIIAHERKDPAARSKALTRALSALTALDMGVDRSAPLADALLQLYGAARKAILDSVVSFDGEMLGQVRQDFIDIAKAVQNA